MRPALEQRVELVARVLAHEHVDVAVSVSQQLLDEMAPDEARRARHEVGHVKGPSGPEIRAPAYMPTRRRPPPRPSPAANRAAPAAAPAISAAPFRASTASPSASGRPSPS